MADYIIALDQGTTSSRALLVNSAGQVKGISQQAFEQHFPRPGWVEHDPHEIIASQFSSFTDLLVRRDLKPHDIAAIGITNQRETTLVWDRSTGEPIYNAIVWQCRRSAPIIERLCSDPATRQRITATTGLIPDAYFSASKICWLLSNVDGARERAQAGELLFGTVDSWLIWNLTNGEVHATDPTNASRTMLYDIHNDCWDEWLCDLFGIPMSMLPQVRPSSGDFGNTSHPAVPKGIPICGVAGDQQAALFGQCCFDPGEAKNTYGTGCFLLMNTGERAVESGNGLVTTIAASAPGCTHTEYALEGSVFVAGALIQWLRDGIGLISSTEEVEPLYNSVPDTGGVYVVPAFTGLGAPYWDADARGAIYGLTRGTTRAHIVRAALDSLAYQVDDLLEGMASDSDVSVRSLAVDGGASRNNALLRFQSALSGIDIIRPANTETTAMGASYLAGLACGFWESTSAIRAMRVVDATFSEPMSDADRARLLDGWHDCIARTRSHTR